MKYLEYIDDYFKGGETSSSSRFEQRLLDEPAFAEEVVFYLTTQKLLQQEARAEKTSRFRELYRQQAAPLPVIRPVRSLWRYVAVAAVVAGLVFAISVLFIPPSKEQMADSYIRQELNMLGAHMSGNIDSVEMVRQLYNKGKFTEALALSEDMVSHRADNQFALEFAGVSNLQLKQYDKALAWFKQLASYKAHVNKGVFYQALTLMKRNQPGDLPLARTLLEQVERERLYGHEFAREWLAKW
jgi:tetratricopeptide (TPR) repeat protein